MDRAARHSILEPLASSSPSAGSLGTRPRTETRTRLVFGTPQERRRGPPPPPLQPALTHAATQDARRDPVSGLALVPLAALTSSAAYRRALAPVLRQGAPVAAPSGPSAPHTGHIGVTVRGAPSSAARSQPNGLVHSVLSESTDDVPSPAAARRPASASPPSPISVGMQPVILYVSPIDLFVACPAPSSPSRLHSRDAEEVATVAAYLVVSRPFVSVWSAEGELMACCAVQRLMCVTRCAADVLVLRRLPSADATTGLGTDLAFSLAHAEEVDFLLWVLEHVANLPRTLAADAHWLASRALVGAKVATADLVYNLEEEEAVPHAWELCARPYTPLTALTGPTQLLPSTARVTLSETLVARLVPWVSSSVADALDPQRLFRLFIGDLDGSGDRLRTSPGPQPVEQPRRSPTSTSSSSREVLSELRGGAGGAADVTRPVRCALAMLRLGTIPQVLSTGLVRTHASGDADRCRRVHQDALADPGRTSPRPPGDGTEEQWYFAFPEHHETSSLLEESVPLDAREGDTDDAHDSHHSGSSPALHADERVGVADTGPDALSVQRLLEEVRRQQNVLAALMTARVGGKPSTSRPATQTHHTDVREE